MIISTFLNKEAQFISTVKNKDCVNYSVIKNRSQRQIVLENYICPFTFLFGFIRISSIDCRIRTSISQPMDLNLKHLLYYIIVYLIVPLQKSVYYSTCKNHDNCHITRILGALTLCRKTYKVGHLSYLWFPQNQPGQRKFHTPSSIQSSILISKNMPESVVSVWSCLPLHITLER